jgi:biotin transport system substrate-specific component
MNTSNRHPTLAAALWRAQPVQALSLNAAARIGLMVAIGVALLTASAKAQIPFYPVPFTMQTFVVLVIGIACGKTLGAATVLTYLAAGAIGLPVFASGGGIAYFSGPTGGFLLAFALAAFVLGAFAERGFARTFVSTIALMLLGTLIIFAVGLTWLALIIGWENAAAIGWQFRYSEAAKILLAALVLPRAWRAIDRLTPPRN